MAYTNQANIENVLGRVLTASEIAVLPLVLASVDSYIDSECGMHFGATTQTRYYDKGSSTPDSDWRLIRDYQNIISIDPCTSVTSVASYDPATGTTGDPYAVGQDYVLGPYNDTLKTYIECSWYGFNSGVQSVAVSATFGFGSVPDDIVYLASYLAGKYLQSGSFIGSNTSGVLTKESIEGYSREYANNSGNSSSNYGFSDDIVISILSKYKDNEVFL